VSLGTRTDNSMHWRGGNGHGSAPERWQWRACWVPWGSTCAAVLCMPVTDVPCRAVHRGVGKAWGPRTPPAPHLLRRCDCMKNMTGGGGMGEME
jgi:hypothetical protein